MIEASDPFLGRCTITRNGFADALQQRTHNAGLEAERALGAYWDESCAWGLDPCFLLAMFAHESQCGTAGVAATTWSWGNTRSPSFGAVPYDSVAGRSGHFPAFASWLEGAASTAARLASPVWPGVAPYGARTSIAQVFAHPSGAVWAPAGDLNDPNAYLATMLRLMNSFTDQAPVAIQAVLAPTPPVYSEYLSVNFTPGRAGHAARALVLHITQGETAAGCIGWFKNPAAQVSSHFVVDRDGTIYATVRERDTAWVNGVLEHANRSIPIVDHWVTTGTNPNQETIGIECAGFSPAQPHPTDASFNGYTEAQFAALDFLLPVVGERWGIPISADTTFGHCEISGRQRADCPGLTDEEWQRIYGLAATAAPEAPHGPYAAADDAYDAWCATWDDAVVWAGQVSDKGHWYGRAPQELARTIGARLLAYDGGYAQDASGWALDEWQEATLANGQLTIWGQAPPPAPAPAPPAPVVVGAAWPLHPGHGATVAEADVTFLYGQDAPTVDLELFSEPGERLFSVEGWAKPTYGPVALAPGTAYHWQVRGRDGHEVSAWTVAAFDVLAVPTAPKPKPPRPPKPPSTGPYPAVVTPTHAEQPGAVTWRNVSDQKVDLAVSRRWRADCDGGVGPWPDTDQWLNASFPGAESAQSPLELRRLTRRLSMHPPLVEAGWRAGLWTLVPASYQVEGSPWEKDATQDYGDRWTSMPAYARTWASQICTLGTAIQTAPDLAAAVRALDIAADDAATWSAKYHCLRVRVRDLTQLAAC